MSMPSITDQKYFLCSVFALEIKSCCRWKCTAVHFLGVPSICMAIVTHTLYLSLSQPNTHNNPRLVNSVWRCWKCGVLVNSLFLCLHCVVGVLESGGGSVLAHADVWSVGWVWARVVWLRGPPLYPLHKWLHRETKSITHPLFPPYYTSLASDTPVFVTFHLLTLSPKPTPKTLLF